MTNRPTPLPNGTRVRLGNEQYPRAYRFGTATITGHFWVGEHLEYNVRRDNTPRDVQWSHEFTHAIKNPLTIS